MPFAASSSDCTSGIIFHFTKSGLAWECLTGNLHEWAEISVQKPGMLHITTAQIRPGIMAGDTRWQPISCLIRRDHHDEVPRFLRSLHLWNDGVLHRRTLKGCEHLCILQQVSNRIGDTRSRSQVSELIIPNWFERVVRVRSSTSFFVQCESFASFEI